MFQSKKPYYRAYIKDRLSLSDPIILGLRVLEFTIKRDALKKANSTFKVDSMPSAVTEGDILILMDAYGSKIYTGVIVRIEDSVIECNQILSLFDDKYLYSVENKMTIEESLATMIETQFRGNEDPVIKSIFYPFKVQYTAGKQQQLPSQEEKYIFNPETFFYDVFNTYGILVDIVIPFEKAQPVIEIKTNTSSKIKMIDNTVYTPTMMPTVEVYEVNKLIVYSDISGSYRGTWFGSRNGITKDPNELTRYNITKTNIVFSDDSMDTIIAGNLRDDMYNHKLEIEMIVNNLYKFEEMSLGQEFDVWIKNRYYNTILTGYEFNKEANKEVQTIKLIFGKVRTKASQRWNIQ